MGALLSLQAWRRFAGERFDLRGSTAVVTGGSRGLGFALARELGVRGARVALLARSPDELEFAARRLRDSGYLRPLLEHIERGAIDVTFLITHRASLDEAPDLYRTFRAKQDGCVKVVLSPGHGH